MSTLQWIKCLFGRHDYRRARKSQDQQYTHCSSCGSKRLKRKRTKKGATQ